MMIRESYTQSKSLCPCDWCGKDKQPFTKGYAGVAEGATGRHCIVLAFCDECGDASQAKAKTPFLTADEAREKIDGNDNPRQWADF